MRLYLASKMRGLPHFGFPKFMEVEATLNEMGHTCFNPARYEAEQGFDPDVEEAKPITEYMKYDIPAMLDCDAVCVFGNWLDSQGAGIEVFVALSCGLPVLKYPDLNPIPPHPGHEAYWIVAEVMKVGQNKHIEDSWWIEPQDNHIGKGLRHCLTHQLIRDGNQKSDGEAHLKNGLCRLSMAAAQQYGKAL